jgi:hypothetical protein
VSNCRGISVSIVSKYELDDLAIGVRSSVEVKDFSSTLCIQTSWGPPSFLYNGYRGSLPGGKARPGSDADYSPAFSAEVKAPATGYLDWGISLFSSVSPGECRGSKLKSGHYRFLPNSFHVIFLSPYHSTLYGLSHWKASFNKLQIIQTWPAWCTGEISYTRSKICVLPPLFTWTRVCIR